MTAATRQAAKRARLKQDGHECIHVYVHGEVKSACLAAIAEIVARFDGGVTKNER